MGKEFIEAGKNLSSIHEAIKQEKQLAYITTSKLQEDRTDEQYLKHWAESKYQTNDYFLNWVKSIFKTDNFLLFYKYLRFPLPSTKIIRNRIEPQLKRVFNAENSDFKYDVQGKDKSDFWKDLDIKKFEKDLFDKYLYKHNSILIEELSAKEKNTPFRYFLDLERVISIDEEDGNIHKLAFTGKIEYNEEYIKGYVYIDSERYAFYNKEKVLVVESMHDLGYCPAHFISDKIYNDDFFVRESIFTYIREEIEEFNFLKTLQKMTEPNGAIPIIVKIDSETEEELPDGEPNVDLIMGSQKAVIYNQNKSIGSGTVQPGSEYGIPLEDIQNVDGTINTDVIQNYLHFHYIPVDILNYLNDRVNELERSIITTLVGDVMESNESSKNEMQIEKSVTILENTLMSLAETLNKTRTDSDYTMLSLKYGIERVNEVFVYYGTDFFLDSQTKLFEDLSKAPNALERKNIIVRINQNRYKNNHDQMIRQKILYDLMPYVSDIDFDKALSQGNVSEENKQYQLRFNYWIGLFEANYGDLVTFYKEMEITKSEKLYLINSLILEIIKNETSNPVENEQGLRA